MIKIFVLILIYSLLFITKLHAQVDELKNKSIESTSTNSDTKNSNNTNLQGCNPFFILQLAQYSYQGIVSFLSYQKQLLNTKGESNPRLKSIDLDLRLHYPIGYKSIATTPHLRANWGVLSSDFRFYLLHEFGKGNFGNIDWQIVMFNIISKYNTYFRIGIGFTRDMYIKQSFTDFSAQTDFKVYTNLSCLIEARYAPNFTGKYNYRTEIQTLLAYKLKNRENGFTQFTLGYMYQNYWESVKINYITAGVNLTIW